MTEQEKYYTPDLSEFHVGFEYEMKSRFGNGTVKTLEDYNKSEWEKHIFSIGEFPYVERTMNGMNPHNHPPAIRVKFLDRQDIEDFGWVFSDNYEYSFYFKKELIRGDKFKMCFHLFYFSLRNKICITRGDSQASWQYFDGIVKNKSELKRILKQIGRL